MMSFSWFRRGTGRTHPALQRCNVEAERTRGNAGVEFLLVPLILLPMLLVIARATEIERANLQLTSTARDVQRCAALVDSLSNSQLKVLALEMMADNALAANAAVAVTTTATGRRVSMSVRISGLLPATKTLLTTSVIVT
ncbi:MAG: hypothetical protein EBU85_00915 [Actinobacteria bacterium]|nr:hypothetical protein [Actinomycetota bacterium]